MLTVEKQRCLEALRRYVTTRDYPLGCRLPGERRLTDLLDASRHVVRETLAYLEAEGYVERRRKSGSYLVRALDTIAPMLDATAGDVISLMLVSPENVDLIRDLQRYTMNHDFILNPYYSLQHGHAPRAEREYLAWAVGAGVHGIITHPLPSWPGQEELLQRAAGRSRLAHIGHHAVTLPQQSFFLPDYAEAGLRALTWLLARNVTQVVLLSVLPTDHHVTCLLARSAALAAAELHLPFHLRHRPVADMPAAVQALTAADGVIVYGSDATLRAVHASTRQSGGEPPQIIGILDELSPACATLPHLAFSSLFRIKEAIDYVRANTREEVHRFYSAKLIAR